MKTFTTMPLKQASWKTSASGIGMICGGIAAICTALAGEKIDTALILTGLTGISGGIGLLCARDNDKTSEETGAKDAAIVRSYGPTE